MNADLDVIALGETVRADIAPGGILPDHELKGADRSPRAA
jgi:hypothetical protein